MKLKSILSLVLVGAMLLSMTACATSTDKSSVSDDIKSTESNTTTEVTSGEPNAADLLNQARANLPEANYEGYEFTIIDRSGENATKWITKDVYSEGTDGDPINDAVYERNTIIEDRLNVKIKQAPVIESAVASTCKKSVLAGDDIYDAVTDGLSMLAKELAANKCLVDLNEVPGINLTEPWWDQAIAEGLSVNHKLYYATGDISIMDNYGTWCIMFNKKIANDLKLPDPYAMVKDGTWTLDNMYAICQKASLDLDGDGKMADWDQYGFLSESFNTYGLWLGSGEKIITKDQDDMPILTAYNERSDSVLNLVVKIQQDKITTTTGDRHKGGMVDGINKLFGMGQGLIIFGGLWLVSDYRDSEVDFGIVPSPKYEETQEKYYNTYSYANCTAYSVPITAHDLERTGNILESMASISKYTLTPAYYEITLAGKFLRDSESKDMIDLILANRSYDLCALYDWGGMFSLFNSIYSSKTYDFASKYAKIEEKTNKAITQFIEKINE